PDQRFRAVDDHHRDRSHCPDRDRVHRCGTAGGHPGAGGRLAHALRRGHGGFGLRRGGTADAPPLSDGPRGGYGSGNRSGEASRAMPATQPRLITVGHSPDPDDAFMFYALAHDKIDTGPFRFRHELQDIETLNRRALNGELEVSAVSIHAYAHLLDK